MDYLLYLITIGIGCMIPSHVSYYIGDLFYKIMVTFAINFDMKSKETESNMYLL